MPLGLLLVAFLVFAGATWFFHDKDQNMRNLSLFAAVVCVAVFLVLLLLRAFGDMDLDMDLRSQLDYGIRLLG